MTKIENVNFSFTFILMFTLNYLPYFIFGGKFSVFSAAALGNRKCKYARFFANITGKMQIIKDYQLH
jgi:hypothetical protein